MKRGDPITPETRVGALLDAYPELEDVLVALSPRFEKLKNPLLRRTVGKVATLAKAASIGDVPVPKLVATLREAAGQEAAPIPEPGGGGGCGAASGTTSDTGPADPVSAAPDWVTSGTVTQAIDADAMLAEGTHPLGLVRERAAHLSAGQLVRIDASFRPAPLLDTLAAAGHPVWCGQDAAGRFQVFVGAAS